MDLETHFNYETLETLRSIEGVERYEQGLIPSSSAVKRVARELENYADKHTPIVYSESGDGFEFSNYAEVLKMVFDAYGLSDLAKTRSIEIAVTLDGAKLDNKVSHVTAGFKLVDRDTKDPFTGLPILTGISSKVQSRSLCFILKSVIAKDLSLSL